MSRQEIKFTGFGGQGIILVGYILGKAASVYGGRNSTMVQSYGPEARGSACSSQVVIADGGIFYPYVTNPDMLVTMSQEAYVKFLPELKEGGILIIDEDLVTLKKTKKKMTMFSIPATRFAEKMGKKIVANIVMLGFFTEVTKTVSFEAMEKAVATSVPKGTEELNLKALHEGRQYARNILAEGKKDN
ncbi:pyruvate ferredoxin oxidoreductase [bacterium (candidate division B38) B3_B38]|nr:MAG: pyruvate ferredoxin oxidoreductase [bacterium (candidate division B38) B3_B38]